MKLNDQIDHAEKKCYAPAAPVKILLDLTISSKVLSNKIADIPQRRKFETLVRPIFKYYLGKDDDSICGELENEFLVSETIDDDIIFNLRMIDWKRDETFIFEQFFDYLQLPKLDLIAQRLGLWANRSFLLSFIDCYAPTIYNEILTKYLIEEFRNDREIIMAALKENGCHLMIASQELRDDFEIVKFAVQQSGYALRYASDKLRENKEIVMEAVTSNGNSLSLAGNALKNNRDIVMQAVKKDGMALGWASEELRNDLEIVTIAVQQENSAFQYASEELRNLKELALLAVGKRSDMYGYVSKQLQNDLDVVFKCFSKSLDTLYRASEIFKNDREFMLTISKIDGYQALQFASNELRNDKEIVMQAVQQNARAICFASQELKCDSDILKLIPEKNDLVEQFLNKHWTLPERFKFDRQVALDSIIYNLDNFNRAASELTSDKEFILEIVRNRGMALSVLDDQFKQDREIVLAAVTQNGEAIIHVPAHFWDDVEIIQQASKSWNQQQFNTFLQNITKLRTDKQFSIQLVQNNWRFFNGLSRKFQLDREIVLAALQSSPSHIFGNCLAPKFKTRDRALALRIVKLDGKILGLMCHRLRKDREIVSFAVQQNKDALQYAAIELRNDEKILELVSFQ